MRPAMKPTTGLGFARVLLYCSKYSAASSSMLPPISPIMTMPEMREITADHAQRRRLALGSLVLEEELQYIDVLRAGEGVTADTNAERLAEANVGGLCDRLVRQSSRARDDTCEHHRNMSTKHPGRTYTPIFPGLWICPGMIPILQPRGFITPGQLGPTRRDLDWLLSACQTYDGAWPFSPFVTVMYTTSICTLISSA